MNYDLTIHCHTIDQLPDIVHRVYDFGKIFKVWLLKGEMGAGKTTFVYRLLDMMGTRDHVSSPSYSIMHEYITSKKDKIYHFDFFRVESVAEIFDTGIDEYLSSGHHCLIEWPELLEPYLPDEYLSITILNPEASKRIFMIKKHE